MKLHPILKGLAVCISAAVFLPAAFAQFVPSAASDAEVAAQTVRNKYISPYTARNISGSGSSPSQIQSWLTQSNFATASSLLSNTNTPFYGGTSNYNAGFFGQGGGLSGAANTLSNTWEASTYANANQIFDMQARDRLTRCENELKAKGFWSNVVDIIHQHRLYGRVLRPELYPEPHRYQRAPNDERHDGYRLQPAGDLRRGRLFGLGFDGFHVWLRRCL